MGFAIRPFAAVLSASAALLMSVPVAQASEPPSQDVTAPTNIGDTLVVEWTGTALAGASGAATNACTQGTDDSHDIVLALPDDYYDGRSLIADFHIEWPVGTNVGIVTDPDLVLTVFQDGAALGSSDGGSPEENVRVVDPAAGTLTAVVCPFFASATTDYTASLTLTVEGEAACVAAPTKAIAAASPVPASSGATGPETLRIRNFDKFLAEDATSLSAVPTTGFAGRLQHAQFDRQLGVPTFLWAEANAPSASAGALASDRDILIAKARAHLRHESKLLNLTDALIDEAEVSFAGFNGAGPAVVRFRQRVGGLEVFQRYINVLLDRNLDPVAVSGYFATAFDPVEVANHSTTRSAAQAIAAAWGTLGGVMNVLDLVPEEIDGEYTWFSLPALSGSHTLERRPRVRSMYYPRANTLEPAFYVELFSRTRSGGALSAFAFVVSAQTGEILHRKNLVSDATFTYRVFADTVAPFTPFDSPLGNEQTPFQGAGPDVEVPRIPASDVLVTLESGPISTGDPWLTEDATQTIGNNVEACIDAVDTPVSGIISNPLNICTEITQDTPDIYAPTNGERTFDYTVTPDGDPSEQEAQYGAIVNMFYMVNWMHDWWYDHGFDEQSGNAQMVNYGRGGAEGDPILAQGQDASGRNNANMATPADGSSPTMQQYLFDGELNGEVKQLTPEELESFNFTGASFGPSTFDVTGTVVPVSDGVGDSDTDGCGLTDPLLGLVSTPGVPQPSLAGNIALVDRGGCAFTTKAQFALVSGASAMVVVNNVDTAPITMGNGDVPIVPVPTSPTDPLYQIPSVMISKADGQIIKDNLAAGEVTMRVNREESIDSDGTLDNQIIAHELFHYVHHRLTDSSNQQARAMSEGWGDINAFMLSARADDANAPFNENYSGAYSLAGYVTHNFWSGIRRAPYSTEFSRNAFTFKHIADGEPTPDGGDGATNSAVHSSGEIWANMMWNCYAGLINDPRHSFDEAQSRMKDYIIGGFKMTPANATYTEARDAVLSVVLANDYQDFEACSNGFAERGAGLFAVSPSRDSADHVGVVEDFTPFVCEASQGGGDGGSDGGDRVAPTGSSGSLGLGVLGVLLLMSLLFTGRRFSQSRFNI